MASELVPETQMRPLYQTYATGKRLSQLQRWRVQHILNQALSFEIVTASRNLSGGRHGRRLPRQRPAPGRTRVRPQEILPALRKDRPREELEQLAEQFRVEASTLARLDHPNLPKVSDYFSIEAAIPRDGFCRGPRLDAGDSAGKPTPGEALKEIQVLAWSNATARCAGVHAQPGPANRPS